MTSGYNFEGYTITDYIGVYSGECALGTGFLSSLGAGFADFFGSNSGMYSEKLKKAKDYAVRQLLDQVERVGGNAVIGLDIDYTTFSADIMGVVANGTAVRITKSNVNPQAKEAKYTIRNTNRGLPFRSTAFFITPVSNRYGLVLDLYYQDPCNVSGIIADITFTNIFEDSMTLKDVMFINFSEKNNHHALSDSTYIELPENISRSLKSIDVIVKKYILDNTLFTLSEDSIELLSDIISDENSEAPALSREELLNTLESFDSSKEIYAYLVEYNETHNGILDPALLDEINDNVRLERIYGSYKKTSIKKIRNYFENH